MVGKEMSRRSPFSRRKVSSASAAEISVRPPFGAASENQARKRVSAAPSRICASRAPSSSVSVLDGFRQRRRIVRRRAACRPPRARFRRVSPARSRIRTARSRRACRPASDRRSARRALARSETFPAPARVFGVELRVVDIERRRAFLRQQREARARSAYARHRRREC